MADFVEALAASPRDGDDKTFHATTVSIADEEGPGLEQDPTLSVTYTADDKIELALKMDDEARRH